MNKGRAYHPLRKLMIGGNPNRRNKPEDAFTTPLEAYLRQHGIDANAYREFTNSVQGAVVSPFSGEYETARREADNAFDRYPMFVVYCENVADVVLTMKFCRNQGVPVCTRAGGHSTAGYSVINDRLLIDVSRIKGIFVDPETRTAIAGAGVLWGEYNYTLNAYGLHNPGGSCDAVGITGYTLGGGYGYTSMRWGIACDNLIEVTLVTANGQIVTANEDRNPELLWAHRGGTGGNFGVVVSLKYQLYELRDVWPIEIDWPIEDAAEVLKTWQDTMTKTLEDTRLGLLGFLALRQVRSTGPGGDTVLTSEPYFLIRGIYSGEDPEAGQKALAPLLDVGSPSYPSGPLWQHAVPYSYANVHLLDDVDGILPDSIKETKRSSYIEQPLSQAQFQKMVDYFRTSPNQYNLVSMEPYGGATNEKAPDDSAFVHRNAFFDIFVDSFWLQDGQEDTAFRWLHDFFESPHMKGLWSESYYQNYPNSSYPNWQKGYFGENYQRLREIKSKWDPDNVFHYEQSIEPLR